MLLSLPSCSKGASGLVLRVKAFAGLGVGVSFLPKMWDSEACLSNRADVGGGDKWKTSGGDSHWKGMCTPSTETTELIS